MSMRTNAMRHAQSGRGRERYSEMPNYPSRRDNGDHQHDGRFHQFGCSHPDTLHDPQCADSPKYEACSEHEYEIEYARFHNLHDSLLPPNAPGSFSVPVAKWCEAYHWKMSGINAE